MAKRLVLAAVICVAVLFAGGVALLHEGRPQRGHPPQMPVPRLATIVDDPVSALTRHGRLGNWMVDVIFANPLLPDNQENGELIFKVFLTPAVSGEGELDPAQGAILVNSEGTVREDVRWQLDHHAAGRTSGYLIVASAGRARIPLDRDSRWIRLTLTKESGESVVFEWNLAPAPSP